MTTEQPLAAANNFTDTPPPGDSETPNGPAGARLEAFCRQMPLLFTGDVGSRLTPLELTAVLAEDFRQFFRLTVPVAPQLRRLLLELDIACRSQVNGVGPTVGVDYTRHGQWELFVPPYSGLRESLHVLRGIFQVLYWRCAASAPCRRLWRNAACDVGLARLADAFAYGVVLPPTLLREKALQCGLNPWQLSTDFLATPSACFYGLRRYVRFPFPYFTARLHFQVELDQQQMLFEEGSVRASVWGKFQAKAIADAGNRQEGLEELRNFPGRDAVIEVSGFMLDALKSRRAQCEVSGRLLGIRLAQPACFVAHPNSAGTQLFLQAVPASCRQVLTPDADQCPAAAISA